MLPCGTPQDIPSAFEIVLLILVYCQRFDKYDSTQDMEDILKPQNRNFCMRIRWSTVSNALLKSKNKAPQGLPTSMFEYIKSSKVTRQLPVEKPFLKPLCWGASMLCAVRYEQICECATFSKILPRQGSMEIGRKLPGSQGSPDLCRGVIVAIFHESGKIRVIRLRLIICKSGSKI